MQFRTPGILLVFCFFLSFFSCVKTAAPVEDICSQLQNVHTHSFEPITKGGTIMLSVDSASDMQYSWRGPKNFSSYSQNPLVTMDAGFENRGWYYVTISNPQCSSKRDSVYVDVKFPQGSPSCALSNNKATFNNLASQSFSYIRFAPSSNGYEITANSSNGDLKILFSSYWLDKPLEDGIYYTTNIPLPSADAIDQVYISDVNQSIFWQSHEGTPVYVSHENGKARISFCAVTMSGSLGGPSFQTSVSAQVTEP